MRSKQAKNKNPEPVGTIKILGKDVSVFLAADCTFTATIAGKSYYGDSFKKLQSVAGKATNDNQFAPERLELAPLDTAAHDISGKYEDSVRIVNIGIHFSDKKGYYEVTVSAHAKGRQHSKEFEAASEALELEIMTEVENRLAGEEWKRGPIARKSGVSVYGYRERIRAYWINPRQQTRIAGPAILGAVKEFLLATYDAEVASSERLRIRSDEEEFVLRLANGQQFRVDIGER